MTYIDSENKISNDVSSPRHKTTLKQKGPGDTQTS